MRVYWVSCWRMKYFNFYCLKTNIIGGDFAEKNEFPWAALINLTYTERGHEHRCGGSLINERSATNKICLILILKVYSGSLWRPRIVWNNIPLTVTLNTFMTTSQSYLVNTYEDSKAISVICCVVQESTTCQLIQRAEHLWARLCPGRSGLILISSSGLGRERSSSTSVCWCWRLRLTLTNILI